MNRKELLRRAGSTFDTALSDPKNPNAKVIGARRGNTATPFNAREMIKRADNAAARLDHADAAANELEPDLDRFKA